MKTFVALLTKGKTAKMNGKMMTLTFFQLYTFFIHIYSFKQGFFRSVKNYKY